MLCTRIYILRPNTLYWFTYYSWDEDIKFRLRIGVYWYLTACSLWAACDILFTECYEAHIPLTVLDVGFPLNCLPPTNIGLRMMHPWCSASITPVPSMGSPAPIKYWKHILNQLNKDKYNWKCPMVQCIYVICKLLWRCLIESFKKSLSRYR